MPAWEDLDDFLQARDFADSATVTYQAGGSHTFFGIYDGPYLNAVLGEYERDTIKPRFTCKMSDAANVRRGDTISIKIDGASVGTLFDIMTGPHPDGTGMAVIECEPR